MTAFRFRLAQVLRLQQAMEDMEKREMQQRMATLARAELALAQAQAKRMQFAGHLERVESSGLDAAELVALRCWHPVLVEQETDSRLHADEALQAADIQREQLQQARLERRTLEQLKERQQDRFDMIHSQLEQTQFDELAVQSWPNEERL